MTDQETINSAALKGCSFDAATKAATHGKDVVAMLTSSATGELLGIQGQTGLSCNVNVDTSETKTKDGNGWAQNTAGVKSWDVSCDGLYAMCDSGRKEIARSIKRGIALCLGVYRRETKDDGSVVYVPIRKGMVFATSDTIDASQDDNMTYSLSFTGTGELWMIEDADEDDIAGMTVTIKPNAAETVG